MTTIELSQGEFFEIEVAGVVVRLVHTRLTNRRKPLIDLTFPPGVKIRRMKDCGTPPPADWEFP